ncbi:MAG: DUF2309 domain-containing protein [Cyanobacteriota/Melainabacteria group bacterium]
MDALMTKESKIRELIQRSSLVLSHYWPMTGFVHHNPIRSLETFRFHEAIEKAHRFTGGRGYLTNEQYRRLVESGRIEASHLDSALKAVSGDQEIELGASKRISDFEVLRAHLLSGITAPSSDTVSALVDGGRTYVNDGVQPQFRMNAAQVRQLANLLGQSGAKDAQVEKSSGSIASNLLSWCDRKAHKQLEWLVNRELIKWCEAYLDEGHASWPMPDREKGFYAAWKGLASMEWSPCGIADSGRKIAALPSDPEAALVSHLEALAIPAEQWQEVLTFELTSLYGWASFINWRAEHQSYDWQAANPIDLVQYLAVRMFYVRELTQHCCKVDLGIEGSFEAMLAFEISTKSKHRDTRLADAWRLAMLGSALAIAPTELLDAGSEELKTLLQWLDQFPESEHGPVWLEAYEAGYQSALVGKLKGAVADKSSAKEGVSRPLAQAMFCIDVRSEPFRRSLESVGQYETIGFAGFFGIPMRSRALGQEHNTDQLPAIVSPKYEVHEVARSSQGDELLRHNAGENFMYTIHEMLRDMKLHVLTPYVMVESLGWLFGIQLFGRTLFPRSYRRWRAMVRKAIAPPVGTVMTIDRDECGLGLTEEEQAISIETALRTMGLVKNFARLVVVAGHTSTSDNNPYEAALNCGACGGNSGKPNARLFAAMANKPHVRKHLAENGIDVPEDTHFIGAVHDTTTDILELYDLEDLPASHEQDVERLRADLEKAALRTNLERCARLPGAGADLTADKALKEIGRRAGDWSETRPEWGLAGNAAFIIGNRTLTKSVNLEGRAFLNSYDYRIDPTGALLQGILGGPMVVGQWINAEHYFSATDTEVYGAGSKIYHNVVGRIGIMSGPRSDLRTGLAWQSMMNGENVYHEPLRLLVVIEAPRDRIESLFDQNATLKQLRDNEWIHLMAVDYDSDETFYRYRPEAGWEPVLSDSEDAGTFRIYIGNDRKRKVSTEV